jgi:Protein of unknown function (DUF1579)
MLGRFATVVAVVSFASGLTSVSRIHAGIGEASVLKVPPGLSDPAKAGPQPGPQIERLIKTLEGSWAITEELAPDSSSPKGKTGAGTIIFRPGPGGYSVIEEYRSKQGNDEITGLGTFWWDEAAEGYRTIWCDSTNPGGCIDFKNAARWEGSNLVLQEDYESNGKKFTFKEVFSDIGGDSFTQTLYGAEVGHELKVDQVIHAKRTQSGAR